MSGMQHNKFRMQPQVSHGPGKVLRHIFRAFPASSADFQLEDGLSHESSCLPRVEVLCPAGLTWSLISLHPKQVFLGSSVT